MFFSSQPQYTLDRDTMSNTSGAPNQKKIIFFWLALAILVTSLVSAAPDQQAASPVPNVFLSFNEGSGSNALDLSGFGATGTIVGASRADSGCGRSLIFDNSASYVRIPYTRQNHPDKEISVSLWFFADSFYPQTLLSTYREGGYRLGFDDGQDLWWTINTEDNGDVSVPVLHESITLHQWHYVTCSYDGTTAKIYLDGILRNQVNASGALHYQYPNSVIIGANAGTADSPDKECTGFFRGGLDEVRIYNVSLTQGQIIDDRLQCSPEPGLPPSLDPVQDTPAHCDPTSGSLTLIAGMPTTRVLRFENKTENGIWSVKMAPGSTLVVSAQDLYSRTYPDAWYIGVDDTQGKVNRGVAFPNTNNAPVDGVVSQNVTVTIRYFDGPERFPSTVLIRLDSIPPPSTPTAVSIIMNNPIIVIYSASWVTLIALIFVMVWLHLKNKAAKK
jgi:hypothetical protein